MKRVKNNCLKGDKFGDAIAQDWRKILNDHRTYLISKVRSPNVEMDHEEFMKMHDEKTLPGKIAEN